MKKILIIFIQFVFLSVNSFAQQTDCICCTSEHKQFDFWLGDWDVYNAKGKKVFESKISSIQGGCGVQEYCWKDRWSGTSYNFYNPIDSTWNQIYLDNNGTILQLKGTFRNDKMILKSDKVKSVKANYYYYNRIIWSKDSVGNISQKWEIVNDKEEVIQVAFDGIYKPK